MTRSAGTRGLTRPGSATEVGHRIAHDREVDDRRHPGEVLEEDAGGHERDLGLGCLTGPPGRECLDIAGLDDAAAGMAKDVLEQDLEGDGRPIEVDPVRDRGQPVVVGEPVAKARPGSERIGDGHSSSVAGGRYTRCMEEYRDWLSGPGPGLGAGASGRGPRP